MTEVWIDTEAAELAARRWSEHGEELHRRAFELELLLVELALGEHTLAVQRLTAAATELWTIAAFVRRAARAVENGDGAFDPAAAGDVARLLAEVGVGDPGAAVTASAAVRYSSALGDPGERGDREVRTPYTTVGSTPDERARHLIARAVSDTGAARRIRSDEFGLVRLDDGKHLVVLPGVVDLSAFDLGWDRHHRSVRDLDRAAFVSSRSTGVGDNPYAHAVWEALVAAGVPAGTDIMVVGHSYGADTALDLAADAGFNGPEGFDVTHVVAAGYHSAPQLAAVTPGTDVLVLQNHRDLPVILEAVGESGVTESAVSSVAAIASLAAFDPVAAVRHHARSVEQGWRALWSGANHVVDRAHDIGEIAVGLVLADPRRVSDGSADLVTLAPGVRTPAPGQVVSVFEGGGAGFGHSQSHYAAHVRAVDDPAVVSFLASVDAAGYTGPGVALAVDVSVPE